MPSLIERTRASWTALINGPQEPPGQGAVDTLDTGLLFLDMTLKNWSTYFYTNTHREQRLSDFAVMDYGDIAQMLDATVDAAITFEADETTDDPLLDAEAFKIIFPSNYGTKQARSIIEQLLEDTNIRAELSVYARDMLKWGGDAFMEIVPDVMDDRIIRRIIHKPTRYMRVNKDEKGRLLKGTDMNGTPLAYQQVDTGGDVVAGWFPHEIVHFKLYPDSALSYSQKGLLDDIRSDWKKLTWVEQGMVIARIVRAYPRLLHLLDLTGKTPKEAREIIRDYIQGIARRGTSAALDGTSLPGQAENSPMSVDEDYIIGTGHFTDSQGKTFPKLTDVKILDPNTSSLGNTGDINYMRGKIFSKVPEEVVGLVKPGQQEVTHQEIAYGRFVRKLQRRLQQGVKELIDQALLRQGMSDVDYRIVMPKVVVGTSWKFADARFRLSMADRNDLEAGFTSKQQVMRDRGMSEDEIQKVMDENDAELKKQMQMQKAMLPKPAPTPAAPDQQPADQVPKAGNRNRRTNTNTTATAGGLGQAAQGYKSGG